VRRAVSLGSAILILGLIVLGLAAPSEASPRTTLRTFVTAFGQPGDYVTQGQTHIFSPDTNTIRLSGDASGIIVRAGAMTFYFLPPDGGRLHVGTYLEAQRPINAEPGHPRMDVFGFSRGCNETSGRFDVKELGFDPDGQIDRVWIDYESHCDHDVAAVFGEVMINVPSPVEPLVMAPATIWFPDVYVGQTSADATIFVVNPGPDAGLVPEVAIRGRHHFDFVIGSDGCSGVMLAPSDMCEIGVQFDPRVPGPRAARAVIDGNGYRLTSELSGMGTKDRTRFTMTGPPGEYITGGQTWWYDPSNAWLALDTDPSGIDLDITGLPLGGDWWFVRLDVPSGEQLQQGATYDVADGATVDISGNGRGCGVGAGHFTIDALGLTPLGRIKNVSVSFLQRCQSTTSDLTGTFDYRMPHGDTTAPASPSAVSIHRHDQRVRIAWGEIPADAVYVLVRYAEGKRAPSSPFGGFLAYAGRDPSVVLHGIGDVTPLAASVFFIDHAGNVSSPTQVVAT
jgi:hypothetical protein